MRLLRRAAVAAAVLVFAPLAFAGRDAGSTVRLPSSNSSSVTVYGAEWCPACKSLERSLKSRDIPFDVIDIERNPSAYAKAREEVRTNSIPITSVVRTAEMRWIVGADPNAVERAYRGELQPRGAQRKGQGPVSLPSSYALRALRIRRQR